jgi:hypothetical protein
VNGVIKTTKSRGERWMGCAAIYMGLKKNAYKVLMRKPE